MRSDGRRYLFTFCPPGPEEREKVTSPMLGEMVSEVKLASHLRAEARSSSDVSVGVRLVAYRRSGVVRWSLVV